MKQFILVLILSSAWAYLPAQQWLWAKQYGSATPGTQGQDAEMLTAMETDKQGNIYIAGGLLGNAKWEGSPVPALGNQRRGFIAKYDCDGNLIWRNFVGSNKGDLIYSITSDEEGNCYFTGNLYTAWPTINYTHFNDSIIYYSSQTLGYILGKINPSGGLEWLKFEEFQSSSILRNYYNSMKVKNHKLYLSMWLAPGKVPFPGFTPHATEGCDILCFDVNGTPLWNKQIGQKIYDTYTFRLIDEEGSMFIAGGYQDTIIVGQTMLLNPYHPSASGFIAKYDSMANFLWVKHMIPTFYTQSQYIDITSDNKDYYITFTSQSGMEIQSGLTFDFYRASPNSLSNGVIKTDKDFTNIDWMIYEDSLMFPGLHSAYSDIEVYPEKRFMSSMAKSVVFGGQKFVNNCNTWAQTPYVVSFDSNGVVSPNAVIGNTTAAWKSGVTRYLGSNEKGDIFLAGEIIDNLIFGNDTLQNSNFGGNNAFDCFLSKYGYLCTDSNALVPPAGAQGLVASGTGIQSIAVNWQDISNIEWGYTLYRSPNGVSGWVPVASLPPNTEAYTDNAVNPNTVYYYKTAAFNNQGEVFSNPDSAKTLTTALIPPFEGSASVFPNPSKGAFSIYTNLNEALKGQLTITDISGRTVYQQSVNFPAGNSQTGFVLLQLPTGYYTLSIRPDFGGVWTEKLVIDK